MREEQTTTKSESAAMIPGDIDAIQDRFLELWEKSKLGLLTPEESAWMLEIQKKYWMNPDSPTIYKIPEPVSEAQEFQQLAKEKVAAAIPKSNQWTVETIRGWSHWSICEAHNTALAAERASRKLMVDALNEVNALLQQGISQRDSALAAEREELRIMTNQCVQLRQELAAERKERERSGKAANDYYATICELRDKLAAERKTFVRR